MVTNQSAERKVENCTKTFQSLSQTWVNIALVSHCIRSSSWWILLSQPSRPLLTVLRPLEVSPNNRAGCKNTDCKAQNIKITKGEIRFGSLVEIPDRGASWSYKHW